MGKGLNLLKQANKQKGVCNMAQTKEAKEQGTPGTCNKLTMEGGKTGVYISRGRTDSETQLSIRLMLANADAGDMTGQQELTEERQTLLK